ncbi:hypothetical protein P376_0530 [Streptomyces sp. HCCB10043]|nr:hypothetical protein P376_0530 [Streptomyces sp. HCCB10043]
MRLGHRGRLPAWSRGRRPDGGHGGTGGRPSGSAATDSSRGSADYWMLPRRCVSSLCGYCLVGYRRASGKAVRPLPHLGWVA